MTIAGAHALANLRIRSKYSLLITGTLPVRKMGSYSGTRDHCGSREEAESTVAVVLVGKRSLVSIYCPPMVLNLI